MKFVLLTLSVLVCVSATKAIICTPNICDTVRCIMVTRAECESRGEFAFLKHGGFCGCCPACVPIRRKWIPILTSTSVLTNLISIFQMKTTIVQINSSMVWWRNRSAKLAPFVTSKHVLVSKIDRKISLPILQLIYKKLFPNLYLENKIQKYFSNFNFCKNLI